MKVIWVIKERYKKTTWCKILKTVNEIWCVGSYHKLSQQNKISE
jgi:hypothetical protein